MYASDTVLISNSEFVGTVTGNSSTRHVIQALDNITIQESKVEAEMTSTDATHTDPDEQSYPIQTGDSISITRSVITAASANGEKGIGYHPAGDCNITNSWVVCSGDMSQFGGNMNPNSVLIAGTEGKMTDDFGINNKVGYSVTLPEGATLTIPAGKTLAVPDQSLTNEGKIVVEGTLATNGSIYNDGTITVNSGGKLEVNHDFENNGTLDVQSGGSLTVTYAPLQIGVSTRTFENKGVVTLAEGSNFTKNITDGNSSITCADSCHIGTATCTASSVCELCAETYYAPHTLDKTNRVEPTCTQDGKEAYWTCSACNRYFSDEAGTTEIMNINTWGVILAAGHAWGDWVSDGNNSTHTRKCTKCTASETEACSGGTATCTNKVDCETCKAEYGKLNPNNHTGKAEWTMDETTHSSKYSCCKATAIESEKHEWKNGVCGECEYICLHKGGEATYYAPAACEICGEGYGAIKENPLVDVSGITDENLSKDDKSVLEQAKDAIQKELESNGRACRAEGKAGGTGKADRDYREDRED